MYYWASPVEAKLCKNEPAMLVGGGNSAGQAAVYLASHAAHVHMLVRGPGLAATMSRYLIDRIGSLPNITLHTHAQISALAGEGWLSSVRYECRAESPAPVTMDVRHLFLFIGAIPMRRGCAPATSRSMTRASCAPAAASWAARRRCISAADQRAGRVCHRRCAGGVDQAGRRGGR